MKCHFSPSFFFFETEMTFQYLMISQFFRPTTENLQMSSDWNANLVLHSRKRLGGKTKICRKHFLTKTGIVHVWNRGAETKIVMQKLVPCQNMNCSWPKQRHRKEGSSDIDETEGFLPKLRHIKEGLKCHFCLRYYTNDYPIFFEKL